MEINPINREIWAIAMREKIIGILHCACVLFLTSTRNKDSLHQFREAAHVVG